MMTMNSSSEISFSKERTTVIQQNLIIRVCMCFRLISEYKRTHNRSVLCWCRKHLLTTHKSLRMGEATENDEEENWKIYVQVLLGVDPI